MSRLPDFVEKRIGEIVRKTGLNRQALIREYQDILRDPWVQEAPHFVTDEDRQRYAVGVLWSRYVARPPVREYDLIPVGFSSKRTSRSGVERSIIFAIVREPTGHKLRPIVCRGEQADLYKRVNLFYLYRGVKLGRFRGGDLIADTRTVLRDPVALNHKPSDIMARLKFKRLKVSEAVNFPSRVGSDGYVVRTDWRVVRGFIARAYRGQRDDGSEFAVYTVVDTSVELEEAKVGPDGNLIRPGLTAWVPPELMVYSEESECDFYGTINIRQDGTPEMQCYCIIPVHAKPARAADGGARERAGVGVSITSFLQHLLHRKGTYPSPPRGDIS